VGDRSLIEWTDATWNPVTGCTRVSKGCDNCYIERTANFRVNGRKFDKPGIGGTTGVLLHPERLDQPLRWRKPRRVFVNSLADLFHDDVPDEFIVEVFACMWWAPRHTFQVLTKRAGRMRSLVPRIEEQLRERERDLALVDHPTPLAWPLPNVWLGVSIEDQAAADLRIPTLLDTPAAVRFLSCEPLLGPVVLRPEWTAVELMSFGGGRAELFPRVNWVIAGGESGKDARPMHPDWARSLRDQCVFAEVPFHFKQWGEWGPAPWSVRVPEPEGGWHGVDADWLAAEKTKAEALGATHHIQPGGHLYKPDHKPWSLERDPDNAHYTGALRRWGKKRAGRELDGRTWDQWPVTK